MSFTGIREIDLVLLDLLNERKLLEKALKQKPKSKVLSQRYRRVVRLADRLLEFGMILQLLPLPNDVHENS